MSNLATHNIPNNVGVANNGLQGNVGVSTNVGTASNIASSQSINLVNQLPSTEQPKVRLQTDLL